jgi:hypothetical protein
MPTHFRNSIRKSNSCWRYAVTTFTATSWVSSVSNAGLVEWSISLFRSVVNSTCTRSLCNSAAKSKVSIYRFCSQFSLDSVISHRQDHRNWALTRLVVIGSAKPGHRVAVLPAGPANRSRVVSRGF